MLQLFTCSLLFCTRIVTKTLLILSTSKLKFSANSELTFIILWIIIVHMIHIFKTQLFIQYILNALLYSLINFITYPGTKRMIILKLKYERLLLRLIKLQIWNSMVDSYNFISIYTQYFHTRKITYGPLFLHHTWKYFTIKF